MRERRDRRRRELNHSSRKENTLICIRAGQASVTYKSAGLHITHRDSYSAFSTIYLHTSYFLCVFLLIAPSFLYSILVKFKSQPLPPNHPSVLRPFILPILSSSPSVHLVISPSVNFIIFFLCPYCLLLPHHLISPLLSFPLSFHYWLLLSLLLIPSMSRRS